MTNDTRTDRPDRQPEALRHFLRSRRARLSPDDVGLIAAGRRHTPGLRREEVAVLAGVSASWYTWLEQGRDIRVSEGVLDAVSGALQLDETERAHLYRLSGTNPPQPAPAAVSDDHDRLRMAVDAWSPAPAFVVDRYWSAVAANHSAETVLGVRLHGFNYLFTFFADAACRSRYRDWDDIAVRLVGQFREQAARFPRDPRFERMAKHLGTCSPRFAQLWAQHEIHNHAVSSVEIVGAAGADTVRYEQMTLALLERCDLRLMLYLPSRPAAEQPRPATHQLAG